MNLFSKLFSAKEANDYPSLIKQGAVIVDVRTIPEFNSGHIRGSVNIPLNLLKDHLAGLRKEQTVITCCRSGNRSAIAKSILSAAGIPAVNGGAWNDLNRKINP